MLWAQWKICDDPVRFAARVADSINISLIVFVPLAIIPQKSILTAVTSEHDTFNCPECGHQNDPMYHHCIKCGEKLPINDRVLSDIEPDPQSADQEPRYEGGNAAAPDSGSSKKTSDLPKYSEPDEETKEFPSKKIGVTKEASGCLIGTMIITTILVPPVGIVTAILWAFNKPYRKAVLPVFLATIAGICLWGWLIWGNMRVGMYDEPYDVLNDYIVAQSEANVGSGHYMSLMELKRHGYLKSDFPGDTKSELHIVEHVLGPTGFIVEIRPGDEEAGFFKIESLWSDQTGDIHRGSLTGPRFIPN